MIRNNDEQADTRESSLVPLPSRAVTMVLPNAEMAGLAGPPGGATSLDGYLHALRRTWLWCLITGGILAAVATTLVVLYVPDQYTAVTELRAYTRAPQLMNPSTPQVAERYETFISNVQQLLLSRTTLTAAMRADTIKTDPLVAAELDKETWLADHLRVSVPKNSEILKVSVTVPDPKLARDLANAIVDAYLENFVVRDRLNKEGRVNSLNTLLTEKSFQEASKRSQLAEMANTTGTVDIEALNLTQQIELQRAQQVKNELARARVERRRAESDLEVNEKRLALFEDPKGGMEPTDMELEVLVGGDPEARAITDEITALELGIQQAGLLVTSPINDGTYGGVAVGAARQRVQELNDKLSLIQDRLKKKWKVEQHQALKTLIEDKRLQSESLELLEKRLKDDADDIDKAVRDLGATSYKVEMQRQEIDRLSGVVDNISRELQMAQIDSKSDERVERIYKAEAPVSANFPGRMVLASLAGVMTFVLPGIGMVLLDVRAKRVNSVKEVRDQLGLPVFGSVPILPPRAARRLGGSSGKGRRWQALLSEAVGGIRANLLRLSDVRVVMVTSSIGGEGKTTVATQLAMSLARVGKRTLLVDFDLPRPAVNNVFDLPLEPGICDVLRCDYTLEDVVHDVSLPNLFVVTSGLSDAASSRFMNSVRLEELIQELREQFDYVIVDGSPLIPVADARVVSRYVDGAICCVLRDVSRMSLIRQSADILANFRVRLLGTVVTAKQDTYYLSYGGDREEHLQTTTVS